MMRLAFLPFVLSAVAASSTAATTSDGSSATIATSSSSSSSSSSGSCVDIEQEVQCREWEWHGECQRNPQFMLQNCRKTCGVCQLSPEQQLAAEDPANCANSFKSCREWADSGKCYGLWTSKKGAFEINAAWMNEFCPYSCDVCDIRLDDRDLDLGLGLPQTAPGVETDRHLRNHIRAKVSETRKYVQTFEDNPELQAACKMSHPNCARFALATDCDDHADHEIIKYGCAAACQTCDTLLDEEDGIAKATKFWLTALQDYKSKQSKWSVGNEQTATA